MFFNAYKKYFLIYNLFEISKKPERELDPDQLIRIPKNASLSWHIIHRWHFFSKLLILASLDAKRTGDEHENNKEPHAPTLKGLHLFRFIIRYI